MATGAQAETTSTVLDFKDLDGWADDDHSAALSVFLDTCMDLDGPVWEPICAYARTDPDARSFFELFFRPVLIEDGDPMLFTGYFEPELPGSRVRTSTYRYPLYRLPPEAPRGQAWYTRAQIEQSGVLSNRGLEIVWLSDPVDKFFLQIQGSGRVRLPDGKSVRVGYGGKNGHPYRSIGNELIRRGTFQPHQVSAQAIRNWVRRNPSAGAELLRFNPSYVFFREVSQVPSELGPLGAMNRSITAGRSIAVDPAYTPLGAPVWIEKDGRNPLRKLVIAQDTGAAIKGAQRADIFVGTGEDAGKAAGEIRDPGRMVVLLPLEQAFALAEAVE
ncbi:MAG: murein transglycosylase A [Rhodobacteraceae bacterium]|nr:murein transglycosylase A [Paracoccaceae bacterium]